MERTHRWLDRCIEANKKYSYKYDYEQTLFPIVQGSTYSELRKESAHFISEKNAAGNAIGGLSVGEPLKKCTQWLTRCVKFYLKKTTIFNGSWHPANLLENIAIGVDMFDCVLPTRNAEMVCYLPRMVL